MYKPGGLIVPELPTIGIARSNGTVVSSVAGNSFLHQSRDGTSQAYKPTNRIPEKQTSVCPAVCLQIVIEVSWRVSLLILAINHRI